MMLRTSSDQGSGDEGFTLVEVMVGMVILSIFLAIFGGAMVNMFHSVYRTQQTAYAQSNINIVYGKLERELRYADGISVPGTDTAGDDLVEFSNSSTGPQVCTQLELTPDGVLKQRTWTSTTDGSAAVIGTPVVLGTDLNPDPPTLASGDSTASVAGPFARFGATGSANTQRLEVALSSQEGSQLSNPTTRIRHVDVTFAALNTGTSTSSDSVCSYGRGQSWPSS